MLSRLAGAVLRGFLIAWLIALPTLVLPGTPGDTALIALFLASCAGALTVSEYLSGSPSLVEFRDAPPFNRIRFFAAAATVLLLTLLVREQIIPSPLGGAVESVAQSVANLLDQPFSPVRLMGLMLPPDMPSSMTALVITASAVAYLIGWLSVAFFALSLRTMGWPTRRRDFNLWINLPTFEASSRGDLIQRLERTGHINLVLGFLLPFLFPAAVEYSGGLIDVTRLVSAHSQIWMVSAWGVIPAGLMMRGIALLRVAQMVEEQRRERAQSDTAELSAA